MAETELPEREDASRDADDRRRAPRHHATKLGTLITRVIGGGEVKLLDFSRTGILIENHTQLTVGQAATIRLTTTDATLNVRGHVVRTRAASVGGSIVYHTAFALDDDLAALERSVPASTTEPKKESKAARGSESKAQPAADGGGTAGSEDAYLTKSDTGVGAEDPIVEFLATVPHDLAELRRRAAVNNW